MVGRVGEVNEIGHIVYEIILHSCDGLGYIDECFYDKRFTAGTYHDANDPSIIFPVPCGVPVEVSKW